MDFCKGKSVGLNFLKEGVSKTYKDYKQSLNQKLAGKVQQELLNFRKEIQEKTPREVYDMAQQTFIKEEIYEEWLECGEGNTDSLRQIIADFKNYMVQTEKVLSGKER